MLVNFNENYSSTVFATNLHVCYSHNV